MTKNLAYWKNNAEEDYIGTPISVLRYITELEKQQIINAYKEGCFGNRLDEGTDSSRAEDYFNNTFQVKYDGTTI
jgi:hypothetical protein